MEYFKSIIIFVLFTEIVLYIVPGREYAKYIRLYMGVVVIVIAISPIVKFFSGDGMNFIIAKNEISENIAELSNKITDKGEGVEIEVISLNDGKCIINVYISQCMVVGDVDVFALKIKNEIIKVYNVDENNINISIRG